MPTRGTTRSMTAWLIRVYFNPRAHEGHDSEPSVWVPTHSFQSTCPRGARLPAVVTHIYVVVFQSTCPRGARLPAVVTHIYVVVFQSTCPRGARPGEIYGLEYNPNFNPRAHEGHDSTGFEADRIILISIHVPTRGTTWCRVPIQIVV